MEKTTLENHEKQLNARSLHWYSLLTNVYQNYPDLQGASLSLQFRLFDLIFLSD